MPWGLRQHLTPCISALVGQVIVYILETKGLIWLNDALKRVQNLHSVKCCSLI